MFPSSDEGMETTTLLDSLEIANPNHWTGHEVEVKLRLTVSWPVCLGVRLPSGTYNQFFFFMSDNCGFLDVGFCTLLVQLLLVLARAVTLGFPFRHLLRLAGITVEVFLPASTWGTTHLTTG
jgi:hypothetical protein